MFTSASFTKQQLITGNTQSKKSSVLKTKEFHQFFSFLTPFEKGSSCFVLKMSLCECELHISWRVDLICRILYWILHGLKVELLSLRFLTWWGKTVRDIWWCLSDMRFFFLVTDFKLQHGATAEINACSVHKRFCHILAISALEIHHFCGWYACIHTKSSLVAHTVPPSFSLHNERS